ncbi:class I SAM-dependent methyltransferase [Actinotalea sp. K2]|uniref:class I SAM-dependent methyltransferase n=1 Tax=Actinotalea sp. K2 TaxID=2939438 RepID=UPI00201818E0|nr:class I SAM-dependent methyltransferase [Actinotalea sp. K2]MCL3862990.1 class I SAM-dependent methyltransferase [Actinotalea sp. K2]
MNRAETLLMNNPARAWLQRSYEAPLLQRLGARFAGGAVVEIGCGRGVGTELLLERFGVAHVTALDLDPAMVERARRRLARYGARVDVRVGDASDLPFAAASIDAVVDFGVIHHVPAWRDAVTEAARVIRPGGQLVFEEVTRHALERWSYRTFLEHPEHDRFSAPEFVAEVERHGFVLPEPAVTRFFGDFVIGVAVKPATTVRGPL